MAGEDQERFEDYLELERYIEDLQAGRVAHPPTNLTPDQARIYRMAALFRSATPEAAEPRPEFAERLKAHLLMIDAEGAETTKQTAVHPPTPETPVPATQAKTNTTRRLRFFSRRGLLTGGAVAAASLVVGAGVGDLIVQSSHSTTGTAATQPATPGGRIGLQGQTTWQYVTTLAELGNGAIRFVSDAIIGYVIRDDGDNDSANDPDKGKIIAMSASCTHMGCLVQWQNTNRQFHCPCHDAIFTEYGASVAHANYRHPLPPLPRLNTKVEGDKIYVEVPA